MVAAAGPGCIRLVRLSITHCLPLSQTVAAVDFTHNFLLNMSDISSEYHRLDGTRFQQDVQMKEHLTLFQLDKIVKVRFFGHRPPVISNLPLDFVSQRQLNLIDLVQIPIGVFWQRPFSRRNPVDERIGDSRYLTLDVVGQLNDDLVPSVPVTLPNLCKSNPSINRLCVFLLTCHRHH